MHCVNMADISFIRHIIFIEWHFFRCRKELLKSLIMSILLNFFLRNFFFNIHTCICISHVVNFVANTCKILLYHYEIVRIIFNRGFD